MDIKNSFKGLRSKDINVKAKSWAIYVWLMVILMSAIDFLVNPNINQFFESLAMGIFGGALFAILPYMFIKLIKSEKKNFFFVLIIILIFLFFISYQANNKIATREENQEIKRVAECYKNLPSSSRVDIDCSGTKTYPDGSKYVGKFKDGKFLGDDKARGGWTKKNIKAWEEVYISACIENQKKSDYNKKISLNGQKEFCYCMSDFIMNRVSVSEVNNEKRKYEVTEAGGNYCAEKLIKKSLEAY